MQQPNVKSSKPTVSCKLSFASRAGFTLIEMIVVLAMISAVAFAVAPYLGNVIKNTYTEGAAKVLVSDLKAVQAKAMAGADGDNDGEGDNWGVCFRNSDSAIAHPNTPRGCYETFVNLEACPASAVDTSNPEHATINAIYAAEQLKIKSRACLPEEIIFTDPAADYDKAVIFNKIEGSNFSGGIDLIRLQSGAGTSKIGITAGGDISIVESYVATFSASGIGSSSATLNGRANPAGQKTTGWFRRWNTHPGQCTDTGGTRVPDSEASDSDLGRGITGVAFSQSASSLSPNTTYYYCAIVKNSATGEKLYGYLANFRTLE